jgi:hypothetical protein
MADKKERCNVRFCSHNGLKSDIAACPKGANSGLVHCSKLLNYLIGTGSNDGGEVGLP